MYYSRGIHSSCASGNAEEIPRLINYFGKLQLLEEVVGTNSGH